MPNLLDDSNLGLYLSCAAAPNYNTFFAARILNGFFSAPAQATGMMVIKVGS